MVSKVTYTGDGATRVFPVAFEIQGENYVAVFIDDVLINDRTTYDIINNSIVFVEESSPAVDSLIEIIVASSSTEIGDLNASPSLIQDVLDNLDNINIVSNNIDLLRNTANGEYIVSGLPQTAALGDLAVNVLDGKIYEYRETGWVLVAISNEGGGTTGEGTSPIVPIEPTLPPAGTEGEFIYNTTDGQFYVYIDGEWKYITAPPTEGDIGIVVVSSLPATPTEDQIVFLTTNNKLYRYTTAGGWAEVISPTGAAAEVADASITTAKFASGITPVEVVDTLPTTDNFVGRTVVLTTDGKLYRYAGASFTAAVPTQDLTGTIGATQIADDAITTPKIAAGAITADEIGANAITSDKITANAITTAKISAGAIGASQIAAGAITTDKIYAGAVAADKIAANAIDATKIVAGAITSTKLAANSVTAGAIVAGAISTYHIGAQVVTANQIAAGAIIASKLDVDALIGKRIEMNSSSAASTYYTTDSVFGTQSTAFSFRNTNRQYGICGTNETSTGGSGIYGILKGSSASGSGVVGLTESTNASTWAGYFVAKNGIGVMGDTFRSDRQWGFWSTAKTYSAGGYTPFTGSHLVYSPDKLKVGELVYSEDAWSVDIDNTLIHVKKTTSYKDKRVVGVVSHAKTTLLDNISNNPMLATKSGDGFNATWTIKPEFQPYITYMQDNNFKEVEINSVGEGSILVCNQNGNIDNGDYLTSSSLAGYATKQDDDLLHNYTVAKALESVDWSKETTTTKMIACTYHAG